jgi:hypothetical protein
MRLLLLNCLALLACKREPAPPAGDVVFICEHGAAKSVIASEYFNKLAAEHGLAARAIARGADPQPELSVAAVHGLVTDGLPPQLAAPRRLAATELRRSARTVAFDCDKPGMKALAGMDACWDDVPTVSEDYPRARDAIRTHVTTLIEEMLGSQR